MIEFKLAKARLINIVEAINNMPFCEREYFIDRLPFSGHLHFEEAKKIRGTREFLYVTANLTDDIVTVCAWEESYHNGSSYDSITGLFPLELKHLECIEAQYRIELKSICSKEFFRRQVEERNREEERAIVNLIKHFYPEY